jgi:hypothetical protein
LVFIAALVIAGCDAASSPDQAITAPPTARIDPAATAASEEADALAGLECQPPTVGGSRSCRAAGFDIAGTLDACDPESTSFGAIEADASATATDRLIDGRPVGRFGPGQFVCIQFRADPVGEGEGWMYVTAVSPDTVPACRTALCGTASARSSWNTARGDTCRIEAGRYTPACPAGWVRSAQVDAYSMGL